MNVILVALAYIAIGFAAFSVGCIYGANRMLRRLEREGKIFPKEELIKLQEAAEWIRDRAKEENEKLTKRAIELQAQLDHNPRRPPN